MKKILSIVLVLVLSLSCFSLVSFAEETNTTEHLTEVPDGYVGVYTIEDLYCIRNNLKANYILMNDIDLADATAKDGDWSFDGRGWNPIGSNDVYGASAFSGVFDGNGYAVKGIKFDISKLPSGTKSIYVGLFSYVSGIIRNLTIDGTINIKLSIINDIYVGGISAYLYSGKIENCISKVKMSVSNEKKPSSHSDVYNVFVGGISGYSNFATILKCKNLTDISSSVYKGYNGYNPNASFTTSYSESYSGGICGTQSSSSINNCYNVGTISGQGKSSYCRTYASGIANCGSIDNSYNLGKIETTSYSAGIGYYATCQYCYNMGLVDGYAISNKDAVKCYYLADSGNVYTGATSLTESQMKLKALYQNWDFDTVWTMEGREDYLYPELRAVSLVLPDDPDHKHEYTSKITIQPTHTKEGEETFTCECGDAYTKAIKKISDHSYVAVITAPTCIAKGYTTYTCECGDTYVADYVDAKGHSFEAIVSAPTCTKYGYTTYICICGENYVGDYVSVKGHVDNNDDYICDYNCGFVFEKIDTPAPDTPSDSTDNCACSCHDSGIAGLLFRLINFFQKLFGMNKVCACGVKH